MFFGSLMRYTITANKKVRSGVPITILFDINLSVIQYESKMLRK
jgi:hypothetical protein